MDPYTLALYGALVVAGFALKHYFPKLYIPVVAPAPSDSPLDELRKEMAALKDLVLKAVQPRA